MIQPDLVLETLIWKVKSEIRDGGAEHCAKITVPVAHHGRWFVERK